jgi:hypothetical protein
MNSLAGRMVADVMPAGARVVLLGASPSSIDAFRGVAFSGPVAKVIRELYAPALGCRVEDIGLANLVTRYLVSKSGATRGPSAREVREVSKEFVGLPVVALSKSVLEMYPSAIAWVPHPSAVLKYPTLAAEVRRKLQKVLTCKACSGTPSMSVADASAAGASHTVRIVKQDERRITYGVVLEPGIEDAQGDVVTAEEIEKAAHGWMLNSREFEEQHDAPSDSRVLESSLAPVDYDVNGEHVKKGSWIVTSQHSEEIWAKVKSGEINGYSIRGYGQRKPA